MPTCQRQWDYGSERGMHCPGRQVRTPAKKLAAIFNWAAGTKPNFEGSDMTSDELIVERSGAVAILTLNRPKALNALSSTLRSALSNAFVELDADPDVHVIILTGAGERAFSAGLDLKELGNTPGVMSEIVSHDSVQNTMRAMDRCRKPIIGAVNGVAITGGLEILVGCDSLIAATTARFADTHVIVEAIPGWGLSQRLSRLIGPMRAKELSLSGRFVDAATALSWGLVNRVVEPDALLPTALELARMMAGMSPAALMRYKSLIDRGAAMPLGEALAMERAEALQASTSFGAEELALRQHTIQERNRQ
jgi:enoyl-CoA hydratase